MPYFLNAILEFLNANAGAAAVVFSAMVATATVFYAFLTWRLVAETRQMRRAQTEPLIEITVRPREEWINLVNLHVRNAGPGPAYNVRFGWSVERQTGGSEELLKDLTESEFLRKGLGYLGPGQAMVSSTAQLFGAFEEKIETVLVVTATYEDRWRRRYEEQFDLDFSEFRGLEQIGTPPLHSLAKSLESLQRDVRHLATGFSRLRVDAYSQKDRDREKQELYRARAERQKGRAEGSSPGPQPPAQDGGSERSS